MATKVTRMELKVVLSSPGCYEKVKKSLCESTEIRAQMYDKKTNLVKITVECGSPERFRDKLYGIDRKVIQSIEILEPPQHRVAKPTKPADPPKISSPATAPAAKLRAIPDDTTHHQVSIYYLSNVVLTDKKEEFEDAIGEQDEQTGNPGQTLEVSLQTPSSATQSQIITLEGKIKDKRVTILIDTGSSYSYISSKMAKVLGRIMEEITPLRAIVADGREIISSAICRGVEWDLQQYSFIYDLRVMDIGEDIILGVDWMYEFSPISFDYKQSKICLSDDNGAIVLTANTGHTKAFKGNQAASRAHYEAGIQTSKAGNTTLNDPLNGLIESSPANNASDEANDPKGNLVCQHCWARFTAHDSNGGDKFEFLLASKYCNTCYKKFVGA